MKRKTEKTKATLLALLALSLPASAVTYWSYSSGVEHSYNGVEIGSANYVGSSYSLAVGLGNSLSSYSLAVGQYLNTGSYSLVVGRYNKYVSGARFIVGNGTSSSGSGRKNALEVHSNGRVVIPQPSSVIPSY